jgi:outer membrane assembly lipoprotein YfiO
MLLFSLSTRPITLALPAAMAAVLVGACAPAVRMPEAGEREPDRYLFERGTEALEERHWFDAQEYFRTLVDGYPQSPYRQEARLGIGDAQIGEDSYASYLLAAETFREFLRFYPLSERADYAQYRLAYTQYKQMLGPQRDQTPTRDTIREIDIFISRYPNSPHLDDVLALRREARDLLSEHEILVGVHYFRRQWYAGAIPRLRGVIEEDPEYLYRDRAYYHLAESLYQLGTVGNITPEFARENLEESLALFDRLVREYEVSEYLEDARLRRDEVKLALDQVPDSVQPTAETASASPQ